MATNIFKPPPGYNPPTDLKRQLFHHLHSHSYSLKEPKMNMNKNPSAMILTFAALVIVYPISGPLASADDQKGTASDAKAAQPQNPTWQDYSAAGLKARLEHKPEKSEKYYTAAVSELAKSLVKSPTQPLSKKDQMTATAMCVHMMYVDGSAIVKGADGADMTDAKDLEELVEKQQKSFDMMSKANSVLKKLSPASSDQVSFEIKKCTTFMAKTKDKLEKAQQAEANKQ